MAPLYAVLGDPIQHSLSPRIFKLFAKQTQQVFDYEARQVSLEALSAELHRLRQEGYGGVNLTAPLKEKAFLLADHCSELARGARAVNILSFKPEGNFGDNSDGLGFIRDLQGKNGTITGQTILILGAGGAARGLLSVLLKENPKQVVIFNRSEAKALQLIQDFQSPAKLFFCPWGELRSLSFDLIINCTSLGLQGQCLPFSADLLHSGTCCYDLAYGKAAQPFLSWAKKQGAEKVYDGLGMLVEQAAEAFYLWRGERVDTAPILLELKALADN
jgi:shikimate dehydrogenase